MEQSPRSAHCSLESLPEIEKEQILAQRQEEIQKYKDSMQLDAMWKMAQMEGDDSDDGHAKKRRKHTSVTTEASRAMAELKNRRKQKDERAQRRAERRLRHPGSASPARHDDASSEEGEISIRDDWRATSPPSRPERREKGEVDLDATPANYKELDSARLSRYELVDLKYKDEFEKVITGSSKSYAYCPNIQVPTLDSWRARRTTMGDRSIELTRLSP